jgi:glycosyltransferase involved in cell wall biosynthesis
MFQNSNVVLTISEYEKEVLNKEFPDTKVIIMPTFIYDRTFPLGRECPFEERKDILFVGGFLHNPNIDGVAWFVKDILPLIQEKLPDVVFNVIGSGAPPEIKSLESKNVRILGYVSEGELEEYYLNSRLVVAPLRFGAGVKGKIIEAIAYGLPVVTTPIGAEGIQDQDNILLVGETDHQFVERTVNLYNNKEEWLLMRKNQVEYAKKYLSKNGAKKVVEEMLRPI